ncbi:MAG: hypothetical protein ACD_41C00307G0003 [uncultured bacterium]|nr:MAG: hypothetical protein ACD_41C00307G0003 [uncultured bacterium]
MTEQDIMTIIRPILQDADVTRAAVFGSFARGEQNAKSDLDLLVEFGQPKGLFDFVELRYTLEDHLHRKVDLVTYKALHPYLKDRILAEQKVVYGERF